MSRHAALTCEAIRDLAPLYVLGALDPTDAAAVRKHLARCPEVHEEVQGLGGVSGSLARVPEPLEPPESVEVRLMAAVEADVRAAARDQAAVERLVESVGSPLSAGSIRKVPPAAAPTAPPVGASASSPPVARLGTTERRGPDRWAWLALAVAAVVIVGLGAWAVGLRQTIDQQAARSQTLRAALLAVAEPGSRLAILAGHGPVSEATGFAVLPAAGEAYLVVRGLPRAPAGMTYEAWVGSAQAVRPAGLMTVGEDGLAVLTGLRTTGPPVELVAVTLERAGGSAQPSSAPLLSGVLRGS